MWRLSLLIIALILVGCAEPEPIRPTPIPSPTPTPSVAPFKSPDGVILADTICWRSGINTTCIIEFPNGKTIRGYPGYASDWSPDGRYAVACIGATHDSPCGIAEVWDMINGQKSAGQRRLVWHPDHRDCPGQRCASGGGGDRLRVGPRYLVKLPTGHFAQRSLHRDRYHQPDHDADGSVE